VAATSGGTAINTSGSQSGVHTMNCELVMQTATTPQSYALRARIRDNGLVGIQISIESTDGVKVGSNTSSAPTIQTSTGKSWHIVANKYQFMTWVNGDFNVGNQFICVCCPFVFSFLTPTYIGFVISSGKGDNDPRTGNAGNWRWSIFNAAGDTALNNYQAIYHTTLNDYSGNAGSGNYRGMLNLPAAWYGPNTTSNTGGPVRRYANGDAFTIDTVVSWGLTDITSESQLRCQMWDTLIITDAFLGDATTSFDAHNWIAVTSSITSSTYATLFVVVP